MKRTLIITSCVLALVIAGIALAARADAPHWHRWHRGMPLGYIAHQLNLNDAQKAQIQTIWQGERPNVAVLVREFGAESKEMDQATAQGNADESRVQEIASRQGATVARLLVEKEKIKAKIYSNVLTADQRSKADTMLARWHTGLDRVAEHLEGDHPESGSHH